MLADKSDAYKAAYHKMWNLNDRLIEDVDEIVTNANLDEADAKHLIESWFGDDFYETYWEWANE